MLMKGAESVQDFGRECRVEYGVTVVCAKGDGMHSVCGGRQACVACWQVKAS